MNTSGARTIKNGQIYETPDRLVVEVSEVCAIDRRDGWRVYVDYTVDDGHSLHVPLRSWLESFANYLDAIGAKLQA